MEVTRLNEPGAPDHDAAAAYLRLREHRDPLPFGVTDMTG